MQPRVNNINHHKSQKCLETRVCVCSYLSNIQICNLNYNHKPKRVWRQEFRQRQLFLFCFKMYFIIWFNFLYITCICLWYLLCASLSFQSVNLSFMLSSICFSFTQLLFLHFFCHPAPTFLFPYNFQNAMQDFNLKRAK